MLRWRFDLRGRMGCSIPECRSLARQVRILHAVDVDELGPLSFGLALPFCRPCGELAGGELAKDPLWALAHLRPGVDLSTD